MEKYILRIHSDMGTEDLGPALSLDSTRDSALIVLRNGGWLRRVEGEPEQVYPIHRLLYMELVPFVDPTA